MKLIEGDCLVEMQKIPDGSVDMILCDLPYGTTACKWDTIIPFEPLWIQYKRIIKDNGAIVLFGSQPFTSLLVTSAIAIFRYSLVWEKTRPTNIMNANRMFMKWHEDLNVFYKTLPTYNPQKTEGKAYTKVQHKQDRSESVIKLHNEVEGYFYDNKGLFHPKSVLKFATDMHRSKHPTQKPVALCEYLIKTYTNEGETVLDNCMGSGTTGEACALTNREFIGIEKDPYWFGYSKDRIEALTYNELD